MTTTQATAGNPAQAAGPAGTTGTDGLWSPQRRALTLGLVLTITFVASEALAVVTIMPLVAHDLHGISLYGWVFSAFMLGSVIGIVAAGRQADRFGPARPFLAGLILFCAGLTIAGLAPTMLVLVAGRTLQGIGAGAVPAVAYVAIGRSLPERLRARMMAFMSTAWVIPGLVGPAVSAAVASLAGWRWVFLGLLPLVAVTGSLALPALFRLGRQPASGQPAPAADRGEHRLTDGVAAAAGTGMILAGLSLAAGSGRILAAVALLLASVAVTGATLAWTAGAWLQSRLNGRWPAPKIIGWAVLLIMTGLAAMAAVLLPQTPVEIGLAAWTVAGFGMGLAYAPISLLMLREAPAGREGWASASLSLADVLGTAFGIGAGGAAVAAAAGRGWPLSAGVGIAFAIAASGAVALALVIRRLPAGIDSVS